jgi:uncharacterized protein YabE (DUF348 family)
MDKKYVIILTLAVLLTTGVIAYSVYAKGVTIVDGEKVVQVTSFKSSVKELIKEKGIELEENDRIIPGPEASLKDDMKIVIKRAVPLYITVGGEQKAVMSAADTVCQVLEDMGIEVGNEDIIEPGVSSVVGEGMKIKVIRVTHRTEFNEKEIPFETIVRTNGEIYKGIEKIISEGYNGKIREKVLITYHDGEEVSREVIEQQTIKQPQNRIVEKGTKDVLVTSRGAVRFKKAVYMTATAYDATYESTGKHPGDPGYGITRSGTKVRPGVVAVDPRVIPLGTRLYVKSLDGSSDYGFAIAEDTGGAIKGNKIDLYFESPSDVRKYGKRKVLVYILE